MGYYGPGIGGSSIYDDDADTGINVERTTDDDVIRFDLGNNSGSPITDAATFSIASGFYFNTNQDDLDFRVDGDGVTNAIFYDASTGNGFVNGSTPISVDTGSGGVDLPRGHGTSP